MKVATWNVNSIRTRADRVLAWLDRHDVDVLALQETKCRDTDFPYDRFDALGYEIAHVGLNQWNGVAIASRVGITDVAEHFDGQPSFDRNAGDTLDIFGAVLEARAVGAMCGGVRVWSLYVPNGRALSDPHYRYKLDWLDALRSAASSWSGPTLLAGDWNVAPTDADVWSVERFVGKTHTSAPERAAFDGFVAQGFSDLVRPYTPGEFTYWDYTGLRFPKNRGMRIDFILGREVTATGAFIDREERAGAGASDHAPVVVELAAPS